ncbi:MAG TPA: TOBE domain-containing protein [Vicinamibacteria bacterium]|nr:TOBE domain-containing protein [Vicinamibacteria bacterium]
MFTRTQVCQALGVSPKTLYLWERQGRIPAPRRTSRGWRAYSDKDVARLRALLGRPAAAAKGGPGLPLAGLSARNQLRGTVVSVRGDRVLCDVVLRLGDGQEVSAVITRRSAERLGLRRGAEATAVIKATEVMLFR